MKQYHVWSTELENGFLILKEIAINKGGKLEGGLNSFNK